MQVHVGARQMVDVVGVQRSLPGENREFIGKFAVKRGVKVDFFGPKNHLQSKGSTYTRGICNAEVNE